MNVSLNDPELFVIISSLKEIIPNCHWGAQLVCNDLIKKLEKVKNE